MNREQRRKMENALVKRSGKTRSQSSAIVRYIEGTQKIDAVKVLNDGDKVRLDVEEIIKHPDYKNLREEYRCFVEKNRDEVFTVEFEESKKDAKVLACLKEDVTTPKWLFWIGNLIKVS